MRTLIAAGLLLLMSLISVTEARAQSALYGVPNYQLMRPSNTLTEMILGSTCISMPGSPLELSCNPAFLAAEEKRVFRLNVAGNDRLTKVNKYRGLLQNDDTIGIVDGLLQEKEPLLANATLSAWYQRNWWAVGVAPLRAGYASFYRNSAYPEISGSVFAEKEVFAKAGFKLPSDPNIRLGLQARYLHRDFFRRKFALLDAVTDNNLIRIEKQQVLYLEPGMSYAFNEKASNSISAMISNLAVYQSGSYQPVRPVFDIGFSSAPDFADGRLKTSTHFSNNPDIVDPFALFRAGAIYDFDDLSVSVSFAKLDMGIGVSGHIDSLVLGLGYRTEEIAKDQWQNIQVSSWLFELGLQF
jgi:hypothetical protein